MLPVAIPGIVTGLILTAGRVFGEAAALLFTAGVSAPAHYDFSNLSLTDPRSPWSLFHPATTLSVFIWSQNSESTAARHGDIADLSSMLLIVMILVFNLGSRWLGRTLQRRVSGT